MRQEHRFQSRAQTAAAKSKSGAAGDLWAQKTPLAQGQGRNGSMGDEQSGTRLPTPRDAGTPPKRVEGVLTPGADLSAVPA